MGDAWKKAQAGQRLEIPAEAYNAFLEAARAERARRHSREQEAGDEFRQTGIVKIRNTTDEDQQRFSVLALREPIISPTTNLQEFKNRVSFDGVKPTAPAKRERFAVLLEPLAKDAIGRGIVAGVTPARVEVIRESDPYAELVEDETGHLRSSPYGLTRILWKEAGLGVKWAVVRLSDRPRFAVFELAGTWLPGSDPEPSGWMMMPGCRPVFYFQDDLSYAADEDDAAETVWHQTGYPPAERNSVRALHQATGLVPAKFGCGDWVWCIWNEHEARWQALGEYEDHWRFKLLTDLPKCGSALAALVLFNGARWCPVPLIFTVVDSLGVAPYPSAPAGKFGFSKHFADSCAWEVLKLGDGCCDVGSGSGSGSGSYGSGSGGTGTGSGTGPGTGSGTGDGSGQGTGEGSGEGSDGSGGDGSGPCITVVTSVNFDPATCRLTVCTREICLPAGATIGPEHCGGSGN